MCGAEDETRRAGMNQLCGSASDARGVHGKAEIDSRRLVEKGWEVSARG
jgi:hypothetical protein